MVFILISRAGAGVGPLGIGYWPCTKWLDQRLSPHDGSQLRSAVTHARADVALPNGWGVAVDLFYANWTNVPQPVAWVALTVARMARHQ